MNYWLLKNEPEDYSVDDLARDKKIVWTGVRNYQARNFLQAMQLNDLAFYYHTSNQKAIVGTCKIIKCAFVDPTDESGKFSSVEIEFIQKFKNPISLEQLKKHDLMLESYLLKQSRLSVMPFTEDQWNLVSELSQE